MIDSHVFYGHVVDSTVVDCCFPLFLLCSRFWSDSGTTRPGRLGRFYVPSTAVELANLRAVCTVFSVGPVKHEWVTSQNAAYMGRH